MVMRSRRLPHRPFLADSPCARGPVLALSSPAPLLPCARPRGCGGGTRCARPLRHRSREIGPGYRAAGRFRRRPSRSVAGTSCSGVTPLRPGLHAPPPRRSSAVAGGLRHRGGAAPSRFPLLLATGHSRSARAPTLPLTAGALLLGPSNLSAGPASSRAGGCSAMESGRDDLSSHLLIFPSVLDRGKEIREGGGSSLGAPEIVPHGSSAVAVFFSFPI